MSLVARRNARLPGSVDYVHLFGWAITERFGHWGAYDHYEDLGGAENFRRHVRRTQEGGVPVGLYLDGYLVSTQSDKPPQSAVEAWSVRQPDGKKLYHPSYDAHSMCPYVKPWRQYLAGVYRRVAEEVGPSGMYIDEFGACMPSRTCYATDHGHAAPAGMAEGEWTLTRELRQAVPPHIATYCEFVPADVACQYLDGAYGHVSLHNHRDGHARLAPHFVNLHRFALPDFKTFELIYYVNLRNGNWFLHKYPFFNGDGYYLTDPKLEGWDDAACGFLANVFRVQGEHRDAFTSKDVAPLVETTTAGVYANRFRTPSKTVWTLHNANHRTVRGPILVVPHRAGARYHDAWSDRPLLPRLRSDRAEIAVELGPRSVGCVVQAGGE